jgi:lipopolysaccharide biosynthesis glycosyltransferase
MDLNALRKNRISEKFNEFLEANLGNIYQHDQTTINVVCQGKTSTLPPKYGMWNFLCAKDLIDYNNDQLSWLKYEEKEVIFAYYYPAILHYVRGKPFKSAENLFFYDEWWEYANKTGYYDEIYKYANL